MENQHNWSNLAEKFEKEDLPDYDPMSWIHDKADKYLTSDNVHVVHLDDFPYVAHVSDITGERTTPYTDDNSDNPRNLEEWEEQRIRYIADESHDPDRVYKLLKSFMAGFVLKSGASVNSVTSDNSVNSPQWVQDWHNDPNHTKLP